MRQVLSIWRVFGKLTECVWVGPIESGDGYGPELKHLLEESVIIPKVYARAVARLLVNHSAGGAKAMEAYPASSHHASTQERGVGLALEPEKWKLRWPRYTWEEVEDWNLKMITGKRWLSMERLSNLRKGRCRMPYGIDRDAWLMLGTLRKKEGPRSKVRRRS